MKSQYIFKGRNNCTGRNEKNLILTPSWDSAVLGVDYDLGSLDRFFAGIVRVQVVFVQNRENFEQGPK